MKNPIFSNIFHIFVIRGYLYYHTIPYFNNTIRSEPKMSIYDVKYDDFVFENDNFIGETVKVVKGRKYSIGTEFVIKDFYTDKWGNGYILTESGEKVARHNCVLVEPREIKTKKIFYGSDKNVCPHCNANGKLFWQFDHFDPVSDYNFRRYVCKDCTADVDFI